MHACTRSDQQETLQQGEHLAYLPGTVTDVSISMHICVAPEVVCKLLVDYSLSEFGLFTCNIGNLCDAVVS